MAELSDYSAVQQKVIKEIINNDRGFHTDIRIADYPFSEMLIDTDNDGVSVTQDATIPVDDGEVEYNLNIRYSEEQKVWFFTLFTPDDEVNGIVHYNTIYNAKGVIAFVILNDNIESDMVHSLPYSNLLILRK